MVQGLCHRAVDRNRRQDRDNWADQDSLRANQRRTNRQLWSCGKFLRAPLDWPNGNEIEWPWREAWEREWWPSAKPTPKRRQWQGNRTRTKGKRRSFHWWCWLGECTWHRDVGHHPKNRIGGTYILSIEGKLWSWDQIEQTNPIPWIGLLSSHSSRIRRQGIGPWPTFER